MAEKAILQWLSRNWLGVIAGLTLLVITISVTYYFVFFLPKEHMLRLDWERHEKEIEERRIRREESMRRINSELLEECLSDEQENYNDRWTKSCLRLNRGKDCNLPAEIADDYIKDFKEMREECFKRYPQH